MRLNDVVARCAAGAVAGGAVAGSTSALLRVAGEAEMSVPASLPLSLDGAGLVAAIAIRRRQSDVLAWAALVAATGTSAAIQWLTAPPGLPAHLSHVVPPLAVLVAFELFRRATAPAQDPAEVEAATPPAEAGDVEPLEAVADPVPAAVNEPATSTAPASGPPAAGALDLVAPARKMLADLDLSPWEIGRPRLIKLMRTAGHRLGTSKADELLGLLRNEVPA